MLRIWSVRGLHPGIRLGAGRMIHTRSIVEVFSTALAELFGAVWFLGTPCKGGVRPNG